MRLCFLKPYEDVWMCLCFLNPYEDVWMCLCVLNPYQVVWKVLVCFIYLQYKKLRMEGAWRFQIITKKLWTVMLVCSEYLPSVGGA